MDLDKASDIIKIKGAGWFLSAIPDERLDSLVEGSEELSQEDRPEDNSEPLNEFLMMAVYLWEKETGEGLPEAKVDDVMQRFMIMVGLEKNVRDGSLVREGDREFLHDSDKSNFTFQISEKGKIDVEAKIRRN